MNAIRWLSHSPKNRTLTWDNSDSASAGSHQQTHKMMPRVQEVFAEDAPLGLADWGLLVGLGLLSWAVTFGLVIAIQFLI